MVTLFDADAAIAAAASGAIDAAFRAVHHPGLLPSGIRASRVFDEPVQLLTGPAHELAGAAGVTPAQLAGHRIWMPGIVPGTEWAAFYAGLAAAFGLSIDSRGPNFGLEPLLETVAGSATVATLVGEQTHLSWPDGYGLRRIPIRDPVPVYPHALIWRPDNPHPALATLRAHLSTIKPIVPNASTWTPAWA